MTTKPIWVACDAAKAICERVLFAAASGIGFTERVRRVAIRLVNGSQLPDYNATIDVKVSSVPYGWRR